MRMTTSFAESTCTEAALGCDESLLHAGVSSWRLGWVVARGRADWACPRRRRSRRAASGDADPVAHARGRQHAGQGRGLRRQRRGGQRHQPAVVHLEHDVQRRDHGRGHRARRGPGRGSDRRGQGRGRRQRTQGRPAGAHRQHGGGSPARPGAGGPGADAVPVGAGQDPAQEDRPGRGAGRRSARPGPATTARCKAPPRKTSAWRWPSSARPRRR